MNINREPRKRGVSRSFVEPLHVEDQSVCEFEIELQLSLVPSRKIDLVLWWICYSVRISMRKTLQDDTAGLGECWELWS